MKIQTYIETKDGIYEGPIVTKEEAHVKDLLHKSAHLLIVDGANIVSRKRGDHEQRYTSLYTTTIGTHVALGATYKETLQGLMPEAWPLEWVGEFRVHDQYENEVNGLYIARVQFRALPQDFKKDRHIIKSKDLEGMADKNLTTPHLAKAYEVFTNWGK